MRIESSSIVDSYASIYTVIDARFPNVGRVYRAWGEPVGHCHAHVWWKKGS